MYIVEKVVVYPKNHIQTLSISDIAVKFVPNTWNELFEKSVHEFEDIDLTIAAEKKIYVPSKENIFSCFAYTPLSSVRVVLIKDCPYDTYSHHAKIPVTNGLAYSVNKWDPIPTELKHIYNELKRSVDGFVVPNHGDLKEWAMQGVLLLHLSLTVAANKKNSHGVLWLGFINKLIKQITAVNPTCIYLLWGKQPKVVKKFLGNAAIVFETSAPTDCEYKKGFYGCNHFNMVNEALKIQGKPKINWVLPL